MQSRLEQASKVTRSTAVSERPPVNKNRPKESKELVSVGVEYSLMLKLMLENVLGL